MWLGYVLVVNTSSPMNSWMKVNMKYKMWKQKLKNHNFFQVKHWYAGQLTPLNKAKNVGHAVLKILQSSTIFPPLSSGIGQYDLWSLPEAVSAVPHDITELRQCIVTQGTVGKSLASGLRGKKYLRKARECFKPHEEKSGKRRAEAPWKIPRPLPLMTQFPHTRVQARIPG